MQLTSLLNPSTSTILSIVSSSNSSLKFFLSFKYSSFHFILRLFPSLDLRVPFFSKNASASLRVLKVTNTEPMNSRAYNRYRGISINTYSKRNCLLTSKSLDPGIVRCLILTTFSKPSSKNSIKSSREVLVLSNPHTKRVRS